VAWQGRAASGRRPVRNPEGVTEFRSHLDFPCSRSSSCRVRLVVACGRGMHLAAAVEGARAAMPVLTVPKQSSLGPCSRRPPACGCSRSSQNDLAGAEITRAIQQHWPVAAPHQRASGVAFLPVGCQRPAVRVPSCRSNRRLAAVPAGGDHRQQLVVSPAGWRCSQWPPRSRRLLRADRLPSMGLEGGR